MAAAPILPLIEYDRNPPRRWVRRHFWFFVIFVAFAAITFYWRETFEHFFNQARYSYAMRACLDHSGSADQIVWQTDAADAQRLLKTDSNYHAFATNAGWVSPEFERLLNTPVGFTGAPAGVPGTHPGCWWPDVNVSPGADIFLHERITPGGRHVLLLIRAALDQLNNHELQIEAVAFDIGTFDHPGGASLGGLVEQANVIFSKRDGTELTLWDGSNPLQIFAGVPDPADASRVHIPFIVAAQHGEFQVQVIESPNPAVDTFPLKTRFGGRSMDAFFKK
jgi:hypothetical protein